jgi:hypothetical protein
MYQLNFHYQLGGCSSKIYCSITLGLFLLQKLTAKALQWPNFGHCYFGHVAVIKRCDMSSWESYNK